MHPLPMIYPANQIERLNKRLKRYFDNIDFRGHDANIEDSSYRKRFREQTTRWLQFTFYDTNKVKAMLDIIDRSKVSKTPIDLPKLEYSETCPFCGKRLRFQAFQGRLQLDSECPFKKGIPPQELELNVPSGELIVANDLRSLFPLFGSEDVNTPFGKRNLSRRQAERGMITLFVGNTCPSVFAFPSGKEPSKFLLGHKPKKLPKGKKKHPIQIAAGVKLTKAAGICTDLWWACFADGAAFDKAIAYFNKLSLEKKGNPVTAENFGITRIPCKPGLYKITDYDDQYPGIHGEGYQAEIKHIGPAKPVKNHILEYQKENHDLDTVLAGLETRWEDYLDSVTSDQDKAQKRKPKSGLPTRENRRWARMLDQMFFTLGGGIDWHKNGWGTSWPVEKRKTGKKAPRAIPLLEGAHSWYPISTYGFIPVLAGIGDPSYGRENVVLNPSFLDGLLNCLCNIAVYGIKTRDGRHRQQKKPLPAWEPDWERVEKINQETIAYVSLQGMLEKEKSRIAETPGGDPQRAAVIQKWEDYLKSKKVRIPTGPVTAGFKNMEMFANLARKEIGKVLPEGKKGTKRRWRIEAEGQTFDFEFEEVLHTIPLPSKNKNKGTFEFELQLNTRVTESPEKEHRYPEWRHIQRERVGIKIETIKDQVKITLTDALTGAMFYHTTSMELAAGTIRRKMGAKLKQIVKKGEADKPFKKAMDSIIADQIRINAEVAKMRKLLIILD
jgi:hypothetical protein